MDVYVPILGLEKLGLDPIQLLNIRNLDSPGSSTLPPATNINSYLTNLLLQIDTLYAIHKKKEIKDRKELHAVFGFPNLNNPEIFQGHQMLQSLGLGLLTKAYDITKKSNYYSYFDFVCATGIIKKYPTETNIVHGDFLDDSTGDIEKKLDFFIDFIKEQNLGNRKGVFVYSGKTAVKILIRKLNNAGLDNIEIKKVDNFIELLDYLFRIKITKKYYFLIPLLFILVTGTFLLISQISPADPCQKLMEAVKTKNTTQVKELLGSCNNLEIIDNKAKTPLMYALENQDLEICKMLVSAGAEVNVPAFRNNPSTLQFLKNVCSSTVYEFIDSDHLEEQAERWGVYWEDNLPHFCKDNLVLASTETTKEEVLKLSLLGGDAYAFTHFYLNMAPENTALGFRFSITLQLIEQTTYNNINGDSRVQALEFSISKFYKQRRYELALQWMNVGQEAPQWRYWDATKGWVALGIQYKMESQVWHTFSLEGWILNGKINYQNFMIDQRKYIIDKQVESTIALDSVDLIAVAFQLDGNYKADPYTIFVKDVCIEKKY